MFLPRAGRREVIKSITSTSYSKSSIDPWTSQGRLFSVRDWGADGTVRNKSFDIDELDPETGNTISSTTIDAEWFTVLEDRIYYQPGTGGDLFGRSAADPAVRVRTLGQNDSRELAPQEAPLKTVGGRLVSVYDSQIRTHDPSTGRVTGSVQVDPALFDIAWPDSYSVFYGDDAVYWAVMSAEKEITVVRVPLQGPVESIVSFDLEGDETGIVIDADGGKVVIGAKSPVPPHGIGITQIFVLDLTTGHVEEVPFDGFIPAATQARGGGLQVLVTR